MIILGEKKKKKKKTFSKNVFQFRAIFFFIAIVDFVQFANQTVRLFGFMAYKRFAYNVVRRT